MKLNIKKTLYTLLLSGCIFTLSCGKEKDLEPVSIEIEDNIEEDKDIETETDIVALKPMEIAANTAEAIIGQSSTKKVEQEVYDEDTIEFNSKIIITIKATESVWVRTDKSTDSDKLGKLVTDRELELIANDDPNWYTVNYYGDTGYVSKDYAILSSKRVMDIPMIAKGYLTNDDIMYTDKSMRVEKMKLEKLEFFEIYKEYDDCYMVSTIDGNGFVSKDNIELIKGNMVVVDKSEQEFWLYEENEDPMTGSDTRTLTAPICSGNVSTGKDSEEGLHEVWTKYKEPRYIVPGAWVECGTFYNRDDGFHDADNWRKPWEYGGDTYLRNGSHGCINMRTDEALYADSVMQIGDKVLIKE